MHGFESIEERAAAELVSVADILEVICRSVVDDGVLRDALSSLSLYCRRSSLDFFSME